MKISGFQNAAGNLLHEINRHKFKLLCILVASFGEAILASFSVGMIMPIAANALNDAAKPSFNIPLLQEYYPDTLQLAFLYLAVFIVLKAVFSAVAQFVALLTAKAYRIDYTRAIINQYFVRKLNPKASELIGHKLNNITRETNLAYLFVLLSIFFLQNTLNLLALLALMLAVNAKIVLTGLAGALLVYLTAGRFFLKLTGYYSRRAQEVNLELSHQLVNALGNIREIKLNNSFPFFSDKIKKSTVDAAHADVQKGGVELAIPLLLEIFFALLLLGFAFYMGMNNSFSNEQIAQLAFFIAALYRLFIAGNGLFTILLKLRFSYASFRLVQGFMDNEENRELDENISAGKNMPAESRRVNLQNISYAYNKDRPVLKNLTLSFEPGLMYAIVGPSGSGKSTLLNVIARLYKPQSGQIIFGADNAEDYSLASWRESIGYVSQEPSFFTDSVLKNITMNKSSLTPDQAIDACKKVEIHNEIMGLPKGYDTQVFENATNFSGGQRRRIAMARALVKNPKILILDETTASVSVEDERLILEKIRQISGLIVIFVTHRYSNLDIVDVIYELQEGSLKKVEQT